jgi:hypothetical protein
MVLALLSSMHVNAVRCTHQTNSRKIESFQLHRRHEALFSSRLEFLNIANVMKINAPFPDTWCAFFPSFTEAAFIEQSIVESAAC